MPFIPIYISHHQKPRDSQVILHPQTLIPIWLFEQGATPLPSGTPCALSPRLIFSPSISDILYILRTYLIVPLPHPLSTLHWGTHQNVSFTTTSIFVYLFVFLSPVFRTESGTINICGVSRFKRKNITRFVYQLYFQGRKKRPVGTDFRFLAWMTYI